ncbi:MAG: AAA family ATPase [Halobacteriota archaeon]
MASPLWTDRYAPTLDELVQPHLRRYLLKAVDRPINLLLHGPPGSGKTAAVHALAREAHGDPKTDLLVINVADFFNRTKREIEADPRFEHFLADGIARSKREMINHVFREMVAHAPVSGRYRTVLLDNAEAVREDFQHALRRLIEQHHRTTQFILTTRQLGKIIPALQSRCLPVAVPPPDDTAVRERVEHILHAEAVAYDPSVPDLLAGDADGNLRRAILAAQACTIAAERRDGESVTENDVFETLRGIGHADLVGELLAYAGRGEFDEARSTLDDLLIDVGLDGGEILEELVTVGRSRYDEPRAAALTVAVAEADAMLATGGDDRVQLSRLIAEVGAGGLA